MAIPETRRAKSKPRNPAKGVAEEIETFLRPIRDLFALLMEAETPEGFEEAEHIVKTAAARWAAVLTVTDVTGQSIDDTADTIAQSLTQLVMVSQGLGALLGQRSVRVVDQAPFWRTQVGQLTFANNGFPRRPATLQEAAAVLGVSRQTIGYQLRNTTVTASKLEAVPGSDLRQVTRPSLYREWVRRKALRDAELAEPTGGPERFL